MRRFLAILILSASLGRAEFRVGIYQDCHRVILVVCGDPGTVYVVEYSCDLKTWTDTCEVYGGTEIEVDPGYYRARIY